MFDFDTVKNRRNTDSLKWDVKENELPLWVADMDFETAPCIKEALLKKAQFGVFGYSIVPERFYDAYRNWWGRRYGLSIDRDSLIFCTGVIPAVSCAVNRLTNVGDNVVIQTPVYDIFFHSVENHGRHVLENKLVYDGCEYSVDWEDLEEKLAHPYTRLMILCNPHNPVGKIWIAEELARVGELCAKHHVTVLSDEIHCDLTDPGVSYHPFAGVSDTCRNISMTCMAPGKSFNTAGLHTAAVMIPNPSIREVMDRGLNSTEIAEPNIFAVDAAVAAYEEGEPWLEELRVYLAENKKTVREFIAREIPDLKVVPSEATYLLWIDISALCDDAEKLTAFIREKTGLYITAGNEYRGNGAGFVRMNTACPRATLTDALKRLKDGVERFFATH